MDYVMNSLAIEQIAFAAHAKKLVNLFNTAYRNVDPIYIEEGILFSRAIKIITDVDSDFAKDVDDFIVRFLSGDHGISLLPGTGKYPTAYGTVWIAPKDNDGNILVSLDGDF